MKALSLCIFVLLNTNLSLAEDFASCSSYDGNGVSSTIEAASSDLCNISKKTLELSCANKTQATAVESQLKQNFLKYLNTCQSRPEYAKIASFTPEQIESQNMQSVVTCKKFYDYFDPQLSDEDLEKLKLRMATQIEKYDQERKCSGKVQMSIVSKFYSATYPWPKSSPKTEVASSSQNNALDPSTIGSPDDVTKLGLLPVKPSGNDAGGAPLNTIGSEQKLLPEDIQNRDKARAEVEAAVKARFGTASKQIDEMTVCGEAIDQNERKVQSMEIHPDCVMNVKKIYAANVYETDPSTVTLDPELKKCIDNRLKDGAKIKKITIFSSANLLNNTGKACEKFGPQGFEGLSEARANDAEANILSKIIPADVYKSVPIEKNFKGTNGDGTSGPCPYVIKNGVESQIIDDEDLEEFKKVEIHVAFDHVETPWKENVPFGAYRVRCQSVSFSCGK